jgi:oligopeptide/dipeptide ABC transporter ATP-binding protein
MSASRAAPPLLDVRDLHVWFERQGRKVHAVRGISYSIGHEETLAVIGESGSGKTVGARALMGLLPERSRVEGSARLEGAELLGISDRELRRHLGRDIAVVFQDPARSLNPTMRIGTQIAEVLVRQKGLSRRSAHQEAIELLRRVRIPLPEQRYGEYPHALSGGMRQRVMIAIALACAPKLLIADEATTALDVTTQAQIMELLVQLQRELHMAVMLISHDLSLAASFSDRVAVMYAGKVVESAPTREIFEHPRMPYTRMLLDAIPGRRVRPLPIPHDGRERGAEDGCALYPRCYRGDDRCRAESPPLRDEGTSHAFACWHPEA